MADGREIAFIQPSVIGHRSSVIIPQESVPAVSPAHLVSSLDLT